MGEELLSGSSATIAETLCEEGGRLERLEADKKGLLKRMKAEAKASQEVTTLIMSEANGIYDDAHRLMEDANTKQR